jgi:hypothetical protein
MASPIGFNPGTVYSQTDQLRGKCPTVGTTYLDESNGKVYKMCIVAASQNLTQGLVVTMDGNYVVTVLAASAPALTVAQQLAVAMATLTASVSTLIWCQVYGNVNVQASTSCDLNVVLTAGAVAGTVDDALTSLSAVIDGIHLTTSAGTTSGLKAAFLNYPRFQQAGS